MILKVPNLNSNTILFNLNDLNLLAKEIENEITLDFADVNKFDPFAMLFFANKVIYSRDNNQGKFKYYRNFNSNNHNYAGNMAFFQYMGIDYGKKMNEKTSGENHIPISILEKNSINLKVKNKATSFEVELDNLSMEYAKILTRNNQNVNRGVFYIIREMLRNIFEHSESERATVCGQYWPSKDIVEIAISDFGIGIKNSITKNKLLIDSISNDRDAIDFSIKPGVSKIAPDLAKSKRHNKNDNSGFGLYMASNLCSKLGGEFKIMSHSSCLTYSSNIDGEIEKVFYDVDFPGTLISLRIKPSLFANYDTIFDDLIIEGERIARNSPISIGTASGKSKSKNKLPF